MNQSSPDSEIQDNSKNAEFSDDKDLTVKYIQWLIMLGVICGIGTIIVLVVAYKLNPEGMRL